MRKLVNPFLYNIHSLDLHGYDSIGGVAILKNFIDNECRIESKKIVVVHGKGSGILKHAVHEYLKKDKRVLEYRLDNFNDGQTIVILR